MGSDTEKRPGGMVGSVRRGQGDWSNALVKDDEHLYIPLRGEMKL